MNFACSDFGRTLGSVILGGKSVRIEKDSRNNKFSRIVLDIEKCSQNQVTFKFVHLVWLERRI